MNDERPRTICDNCKAEVPSMQFTLDDEKRKLADNGFCLDLSGYYAGFTDDISGETSNVIICHDCSLSVVRALPGIFPDGIGLHSMFNNDDKTSCCEFAWKFDDNMEVLIGDGKGGWVPREGN
jgi:hypothetical protein